jgi:hypothetical protein
MPRSCPAEGELWVASAHGLSRLRWRIGRRRRRCQGEHIAIGIARLRQCRVGSCLSDSTAAQVLLTSPADLRDFDFDEVSEIVVPNNGDD